MVRLSWRYAARSASRECSPMKPAQRHAVGAPERRRHAFVGDAVGGHPESRRKTCRPRSSPEPRGPPPPPTRAAGWTPPPAARRACPARRRATSLSVWRRSRSASALSSFEAATTMPKGALRPRPRDRHADGLIDVVALLAGLEPESLGGLPLQRPADQCASGEVLVEHAPLGGPGLEHARAVGDEHPVRAGLGPKLVGLIEQVGAIAGAKRLLDAGDVGRHLDQGLGEPAERLASARERVTDGGRRGADSPRRGGVGRLVGAMLGDEKGCAEDHDHHRRGAEEDSGAQRHGS